MNYCLFAAFTLSNGAVQMKGTELLYPMSGKWKKDLYNSYCKIHVLPWLRNLLVTLLDVSFSLVMLSICLNK